MAKKLVFLQLAPEFGSTKFGPFAGAEIRLGSDPGRNDIVLPEALGIAPEHARLVKQADESFIVSPVDRMSHVYLFRADGRAPKQITSPVAVVGGDGFSLVTAEGPRFLILLEFPKSAAGDDKKKDPLAKAKEKLNTGTMLEEIKRQGFARALTSGVGNMAQTAWMFIKSGTFLQPRYILLGLTIASGWILAGGIGCSMAGLGYHTKAVGDELQLCQGELAMYQSGPGNEEPTLASITGKILGDDDWFLTLNDDGELRKLYVEMLRDVRKNGSKYSWVWTREDSPFGKFRGILAGQKLHKNLVRTLAYAAATPGANQEREWDYVFNSDEKDICGRGPALLTWRQAKNLNFEQLQLDAAVDASVSAQQDVEAATAAFISTAGEEVPLDSKLFKDADVPNGKCIYVDGEDARMDTNLLVAALKKEIDVKAKGLPSVTDHYWIANRLLKLYAADFERGFADITYEGNLTPSTVLSSEKKASRKTFALRSTAEVMARAALLPCLAKQDKTLQNPSPGIKDDMPESKMTCAMFLFLIDEG